MKLISFASLLNKKLIIIEFLIWCFWFIALYPGRVGYDTKLSLEMIRQGKSTNWWTPLYWRFLEIITFDGKTILWFTLFSILLAVTSLHWLIDSFPEDTKTRSISIICLLINPCFPVFALTVQHDCLFLYGIVFLIGLEMRLANGLVLQPSFKTILIIFSTLLVMTTNQGLVLILFLFLRWCFIEKSFFRSVIILIIVVFLGYVLPSVNINTEIGRAHV